MLTKIRADELLVYDPKTGALTWRVGRRGTAKAGMPAGSVNKSRLVLWLDGERHSGHRVIWLMQTGHWPVGVVDHIDGDSINNRWVNLRDVTWQENSQNRKRANANSSLGLLGVSADTKGPKFQARIRTGGRSVCLGLFETAQSAHEAYLRAKRALHDGNTL